MRKQRGKGGGEVGRRGRCARRETEHLADLSYETPLQLQENETKFPNADGQARKSARTQHLG
jgi:hypothetical protein